MSEIANYFLYRNAEGETGLSANSIDDLNLDDLFAEIDYCHSSIGRQYLYYLLLSDKTSGIGKTGSTSVFIGNSYGVAYSFKQCTERTG